MNGNMLASDMLEKGANIDDDSIARSRDLLKYKPNDLVLPLHLARLVSRCEASDEGKILYCRVMRQLVTTDPKRALEIFHEFYEKYFDIADPLIPFRLAALMYEQKNLYHAGVTLEAVGHSPEVSEALRVKALYRSAAIRAEQGQHDARRELYAEVVKFFPESDWATKARGLL